MSPRGWPKGKPRGPRGPATEAQRATWPKLAAAGARARKKKKLRAAIVSSGHGFDGDFRPQRAHIDTTPAVWKSAYAHVGDCEYLDDSLDEVFMRSLQSRVVYAHSVCGCHEPPFQDVTLAVIAATEVHGRKLEKYGRDPRKTSLALPTPRHIEKLPLTKRQLRIIGLLAAGHSTPMMARMLGIQERTVKMHCDVLRAKFAVEHRREIPFAYRKRTGKDPFELAPTREGPALTAVVAEMFTDKPGRTLIQVVSEMFPERTSDGA